MLTALIIAAAVIATALVALLAFDLSVLIRGNRIWRWLVFAVPLALLIRLLTLRRMLSLDADVGLETNERLAVLAVSLLVIVGLIALRPHLRSYLRSAQALRSSDERFRRALDRSSDAAVLVDSEMRITYLNDAGCELSGYQREDVLGRSYGDFFVDSEFDARRAVHQIEELGTVRFTQPVRRADGAVITVEHNVIALGDGTYLGVAHDITPKLESERALRESEERFRAAIDTMQNGLIVIDARQRPVMVNHAFCELVGYTEQEILRSALSPMIIHPDDRPWVRERGEAILAGDYAETRDRCRLVRKDGEIVHVEGMMKLFALAGGSDGLLMECVDVTARVTAERARRDSEQRFRTVFESSQDGLLVFGVDGRPTMANGALCRLLGYERDELLGLSWDDVLDEDAARDVWRRYEEIVAGDLSPQSGTFKLRRKDGGRVHVEATTSVIREGDRVTGVLVEARDITARVTAEQALQESEQRFRTVVGTAQNGLVILDGDGRALLFNDALCEMLGYGRQEMEQMPLARVLVDEQRDAVYEGLAARARGDVGPRRSRMRLVRKDGRTIDADVSSSVFKQQGEIVGSLIELRDVTEELALERAVRESEERLETVLETMGSGIVVVGRDERPFFVNSAFCELVGYSREQCLAMPLERFFGEEQFARAGERFEAILGGEQRPGRYRAQLRRADGEEITVEATAAPFRRGSGIVGVLVEMRDVTHELALQRRAASSAAEVDAILETAPDPILRIDERGVILRANVATRDVFGWDPDELAGQNIDVLVGGAAHREHGQYLERYLATGEASTDEGLVVGRSREAVGRRRDGSEFPIEISVAEMPVPVGLREFTGVVRDVSERAAARRALEESAEHLQSVVETVQSGLLIRDLEQRPVWFNQAACDMFGYTREEFAKLKMDELVVSEDLPDSQERLAALAAGGVVPGAHFQGRRKDGAAIDIEVSAMPFSRDGEIVGVLAEFVDVTERGRLRDQLLQSQKMEAVGTLVAGVAHDFNNLLTAIGGSIEIAQQEEGSSPWLEKARLATDRAAELVQQLLQFSSTGEKTRRIVDVEELARESITLVGETGDRRIEIALEASPNPLRVWADRGQLQQVLMNLLVNARDAVAERMERERSPSYAPRITLTLALAQAGEPADDGRGSYVELRLSDNGCGMPPEVRNRVFDPFFTTKAASSGTGLGLSTAYGIINDHGGSMTVESAEAFGTTFTVRLPASTAEPSETDGPAATDAVSGPGRGERVLIVDDELAVIEIAHQVLARAGYHVVSATGGDRALRLSADQSFDLVLLDVNMPAPNGWQTLHKLLKDDPHQRVLMLSGYALDEEARERGALGLLNKPFDRRALVSAVEEALTV